MSELQYCLKEIKAFPQPPPGVKDVMSAMLVILGHSEGEAKDYVFVKQQLAQSSLLSRLENFDPKTVTPEQCKLAKKILGPYKVEDIEKINLAAAQFFSWCQKMIDQSGH